MTSGNDNKKIDLASQGCVLVGVEPITSFTEGSAAANAIGQLYEPLVKGELSVFPWPWATVYFDLQPNFLSASPLRKFDSAYQLPTDPAVLSIDGVFLDDTPLNYTRRQNEIHTDTADTESPILQYRFRAGEIDWAPYFDLLIILRIASLVASAVVKDANMAKEKRDEAEIWYRRARHESSKAQPKQPLRLTRLRASRRGGIERTWRNR